MLPSWLVYPAALPIAAGAADYIRGIRRNTVTPNLVSWCLWSFAPLIALAAQLRSGVGAEATLSATVGLCSLTIFLAGLRQGTFQPKAFDWWCGGMSLAALVSWQLTGSGALGVGLSIVADACAAAPTLRKAYTDPGSESSAFFACFAISALVVSLTISQWTFVNAAFTVYIFALYAVLFVLVRYKIGARDEQQGVSVTD
jgi:hypothetical protein